MNSLPDNDLASQTRLKVDRLNIALKFYPLAVASTYALLVLNSVALWSVAESGLLVTWVLAATALTVYRLHMFLRFPDWLRDDRADRLWHHHVWVTFLSGALWGWGALFLMPAHSAPHMLIYAITVAGLCAGASSTLATTPRAYLYFILAALVPIAAKFYTVDDVYGKWLIVISAIYCYYMWNAGSRNSQTVVQNLLQSYSLEHQACHDTVTGLANRRSFSDRLAGELADKQHHDSYSCVMFIDLDHFKTINDSLGHAVGDELLKQVSSRLLQNVNGRDLLARFGGDEFVLLLSDLGHDIWQAEYAAADVAESLRVLMEQPFSLEGNQYTISASIGVVLFNDPYSSEDELLKRADLALYRSKGKGRNAYTFFEQQMEQKASRHLSLLRCLRGAALNDEFFLVFQPKVQMKTFEVRGAEVLLRWQSEEFGMVSPGEFIPVIEGSAMMNKIGSWVLDKSFEQLARWLSAGIWRDGMRLAINISPRQLLQGGFVGMVAELLRSYQLRGDLFEFEITENVLVADAQQVSRVLGELSGLGIRFSIDDFGTGYSSLAYLNKMPIDVLKIDKSFIDRCTEQGNDRAIIYSILSICNSLGLTSVAEGVELEEQRWQLAEMGCDLLQGYLFSRPIPAAEFESRYLLEMGDTPSHNSRQRRAG